MDSFREILKCLVPDGTPEDNVFRLNCGGQELTAREGSGNVVFEVSRGDECARREYDYDTAYRALSALRSGSAVLNTWFPPKQNSGSQRAGRIFGVVFGVLLALGAGFCSFAVLVSSLVYGSQSPLENWAMQIFFVGMLIAGIALAWSTAKKKLTVSLFFGAGIGFVMFTTLLSLILGIWSTRAGDPETPLHVYIVLTVVFGIFALVGLALMIYTLRSGDSPGGGYFRQPRLQVEASAQALAPVAAEIKERTACKAIRIKLDFDRQTALYDSRLGGLPYWDTSMAYPCDEQSGKKLALLAQINLSQLPENDFFPKEGMLQFFVLPDVEYGVSSTQKVIYHRTVDRNVREKDIRALGVTEVEKMEDADFPVTGVIAMDFETVTTFMTPYDNRFAGLLCEIAEEKGIELFDISPDSVVVGIDEDDGFYEESTGHRIGGYPYFTQYDPRSEEYLEKYDFLLLQIDTDDKVDCRDKGVMWGDAGVGQFFISSEDLSRMELDDVYYTWDCY